MISRGIGKVGFDIKYPRRKVGMQVESAIGPSPLEHFSHVHWRIPMHPFRWKPGSEQLDWAGWGIQPTPGISNYRG